MLLDNVPEWSPVDVRHEAAFCGAGHQAGALLISDTKVLSAVLATRPEPCCCHVMTNRSAPANLTNIWSFCNGSRSGEFSVPPANYCPFFFRGRTIHPISAPTTKTGRKNRALCSTKANTTTSPTVHGDTRAQAAGRSLAGRTSQKAPSNRPTRRNAAPNALEKSIVNWITAATVQPIDSRPTSARFRRISDSLIMASSHSSQFALVGHRKPQAIPLNTIQCTQLSIRSPHTPLTDTVCHNDQSGRL